MKISNQVKSTIKTELELGTTRDQILLKLAIEFQLSPGQSEKIFKSLGIQFRTLGYREWTAKAFLENPELTLDEWVEGVSEFLTSVQNYKQLYPLFKALSNKTEM